MSRRVRRDSLSEGRRSERQSAGAFHFGSAYVNACYRQQSWKSPVFRGKVSGVKQSLIMCLFALGGILIASVLPGQTSAPEFPKTVVSSHQGDPETTRRALEKQVRTFSDTCDPNGPGRGFRRWSVPRSVADSMGGRVKTIRVLRFATPANISPRDVVRKVWNGKFETSTCYVDWAEMTFWTLEARVEFQDGRQGLLITDGMHVVLQDHDGMTWFLRLLPAAQ